MINKFFSKFSLFWRCFLTYIFCTLLFLLVLIFSFRRTTGEWQKAYIQDRKISFAYSCEVLSKDIISLYALPEAMSVSSAYRSIISSSGLQTGPDHYYASQLRNALSSQCTLFSVPKEVFLCMELPEAVITSLDVYADFSACFEKSHLFDTTDIIHCLKTENTNKHMTLYPENTVRHHDPSGVKELPLILYLPAHKLSYVFCIPSDNLLAYFQYSSLPSDTKLSIWGPDGTLLISRGGESGDPDNYVELSGQIPAVSCRVTLELPMTYFREVFAASRREALITFSIFTFLGLAFCVIFSRFSVMPIKKLLNWHQIPEKTDTVNEVSLISEYLGATAREKLSMERLLLFNLMSKVFSGFTISEQEYEKLHRNYAIFSSPMYTAILRYYSHDASVDYNQVLNEFHDRLPDDFICEPLNQQEIGLIFPAAPETVLLLEQQYYAVKELLPKNDILNCGVSAPFQDHIGLTAAVQQALYSLTSGSINDFHRFSETAVPDDYREDRSLLQDFRPALTAWNVSEINRIFDQLEISVRRAPLSFGQEVFFTLLTIIKEVSYNVNFPTQILNEQTYSTSISAVSNLRALRQLITKMIEIKQAQYQETSVSEGTGILAYITESCADPSLSVTNVAREFNRSEHYVTTAVSELSGKSFFAFLSETRMQKAAALLRDTDLSISQISDACGLLESTFYRNFKKRFGVTPADYREQLQGGNDSGGSAAP